MTTNPVFPCSPDSKGPLISGGFYAATNDPEQIARWQQEFPICLWGLPTGESTGLMVLDLDTHSKDPAKAEGATKFLAENSRRIPLTRTVQTRSGGLHVFFKHVPGVRSNASSLAPGVDIRAEGGYVIDWAQHGFPVVVGQPIAPAPEWLLLAITERQIARREGEITPAPSVQAVVDALSRLPNSMDWVAHPRDYYRDIMLAAAGCYRELGEPAEIADAAMEFAMRGGNDPQGEASKWASDWVPNTKYSGWPTLDRYGAKLIEDWGTNHPARTLEAVEDEFASVLRDHGEAPARDTSTPKSRFRLLPIDEVEEMPDPTWLISGVMPETGLVFMYGPPKQGKTFAAISMGLHIAAGMAWFGRQVEQGAVVYIAGEGAGGLKLRIRAARQHYRIPASVPFWTLPRAVDFSDAKAVTELAQVISDTIKDAPVRLIVIDTLARATAGVDENSAGDMGRVINLCDALKERFQCAVMPVHHQGKDTAKGMRGSTALDGSADAAFQVTRQKADGYDAITIANAYQKEGEEFAPMYFDLTLVESGPRGSLALTLRAEPPGMSSAKLKGPPARLMKLVLAMLVEQGGTGKLHREDVVARAQEGSDVSACERSTDRRKAINKVLDGLIDEGHLIEADHYILCPGVE